MEEMNIKIQIAKFFEDGGKYDVDVKGLVNWIRADRKAILDRITEPLKTIKASYKNGITAFSYQDAIDQSINLADEMKGE